MSISLSIPTVARGRVRAFIKAQAGFDQWLVSKGIDSRDVKNADLVDFADQHGLIGQVRTIIQMATGTAAVAQPAVRSSGVTHDVEDSQDFRDAMAELKAQEDAKAVVAAVSEIVASREGAFDLDDLLKGVEPFIAPMVRDEIVKALKPVVDAANKPAVETIIEREVVREVQAQPVAKAGERPYAVKTGKQIEFNKLFGTKSQQPFGKRPITLWNSHGAAPAQDAYYVMDANNMGLFATAAERETNVWLVGPGGSGKTSLPEQFAAYTGREFYKIGFTKQTEVGALVGGDQFKKGETVWQDGALVAALKRPGAVILLDEFTLASAGVQGLLQGIADTHRTYTVHATGEVIRVAPGVMLCVADNTNGSGDETGRYNGTNQSNTALVNRFGRMIKIDYLSKAQESAALRNWTHIPLPAAEHVVDFFHRARKLPEMDGAVLSLRQMIGFVNTVIDGFSSKVAFEVAILNAMPNTERAALDALATLEWNAQFEALLAGNAVAPTVQPSDSASAAAFDDEVSASLNR